MPKMSRNGILNVFELFFLNDINIHMNIGIGDSLKKKNSNGMSEIFYFRCNSPIFIEYVGFYKHNFDIIMGNYVKIFLTL